MGSDTRKYSLAPQQPEKDLPRGPSAAKVRSSANNFWTCQCLNGQIKHQHVQTLAIAIAIAKMPKFERANVWPAHSNIGTSKYIQTLACSNICSQSLNRHCQRICTIIRSLNCLSYWVNTSKLVKYNWSIFLSWSQKVASPFLELSIAGVKKIVNKTYAVVKSLFLDKNNI